MATTNIYDIPMGVPMNSTDVDEWVSAAMHVGIDQGTDRATLAAWFSYLMAAGRQQVLDETVIEQALDSKDPTATGDPITRGDILSEALRLVTTDRQEAYGSPDASFGKLAEMWTAITGVHIKPWQVPLMMAALKISRIMANPAQSDSWVDLAGYAALGGEVADSTRPEK